MPNRRIYAVLCALFCGCVDRADGFGSDPAKQPHKCGQILLDIFACASLADSCENFESSISLIDGKSMRCEEPNARFHSLDCTA